ncbi:hypothetical protein [Halomicrococcus sp. NG-SE-24]|uniref:hypothetical protein n=1 Tax=Halomicrococcus sp. NG-SE-24 TaxID=3436928 RepID=UPI003D96916B
MTESATEWSGEHPGRRSWSVAASLLKGVGTGLVAGMASFVYNMSDLMAVNVDPTLLLVITMLSGVFAHLLSKTLRESIRVGLVGYFSGGATIVAAWIAPLWMVPYSSGAREILLPKLAGEAVTAAFLVFTATFFGAYLAAVIVEAYL